MMLSTMARAVATVQHGISRAHLFAAWWFVERDGRWQCVTDPQPGLGARGRLVLR